MRPSPLLSVTVVVCLILPVPARALVPPPYTLGLSRLRAGGAADEALKFERLEKRLLRTLENTPELGVQVQSLSVADAIRGESDRTRKLEGLAARMVAGSGGQSEVLVANVEGILSETPLQPEDAPLVQSTRLAQSIVFWRKALFKEANKYLELARRMHPQGALDESLDALLAGAEAARFRHWLSESQKTLVYECSLDLSISPAEASVLVNGFEMGVRRHFELIGATRYQIVATAPGYLPRELSFECKGAGQWIEALQLLPGAGLDSADLLRVTRLAKSPGIRSLVVVDSDRLGAVRFFLYTAGIGLEPIPTESPLTLASLDQQNTEEKLPISSEALSGMIENHRKLPLGVGLGPTGEFGYDSLSGTTKLPDSGASPDWYEKREFWWLLGGLGAAVLTGLVISRSPGRPNGGLQGGVE